VSRRDERYPEITERGLSIVEVMIAAALLLIIALGILPLFSRSIIANRQGLDSTEVSNMARTQMEEYVQLPFNHLMLTVPDGTQQLVVEQHYSEKDDKWKLGKDPAGGDTALFVRTTTIRQFGIDPTAPSGLTAAIQGGEPPATIHLKEIQVNVLGHAGGPLGPQKQITVRVFKSH
jgi:type II secretory pathway pseudopilin PulG